MIFVKATDAYANIPAHLVRYLTTGQGVFETLLFDEGKLWFWERHARRLSETLKFFNVSFDSDAMWSDLMGYCKQNYADKRLRVKVTLLLPLDRQKKQALTNEVLVQIEEMNRNDRPPASIKLQLQPSPLSIDNKLTSLKTINYGYNLFGFALANEKQFEEVLFFNSDGFILESSRANIFGIKSGQIFTPELQLGILPGTVRSILRDEMDITETKIHTDQLHEYDCFFLTGAVREILPVGSIDYHIYQTQCPEFDDIRHHWEKIKVDYRQSCLK